MFILNYFIHNDHKLPVAGAIKEGITFNEFSEMLTGKTGTGLQVTIVADSADSLQTAIDCLTALKKTIQ